MKKYLTIIISLLILLTGATMVYVVYRHHQSPQNVPSPEAVIESETMIAETEISSITVEESETETETESETETEIIHHEITWDTTGIENQPYLVAVNRAANTVTVYSKDDQGNYTVPERAMLCSTSKEEDGTPLGTFTTGDRYEWCRMVDDSWGRYAIRIHDLIMFHTICYTKQTIDSLEYAEYNKLGTAASLGCIRLCCADELWLYENCPRGFTVVIYDDAEDPGPLGKPELNKINVHDLERRGWDPTDPSPENPW